MQTVYTSFNDEALTGRLRFMQVDEAIRSTLREFWKHVQPVLPGILDAFYGHVAGVPHLA